ncbi:Ankyrin repeat protein 1 [Giardia muris]|uniref:Ankyrin repeat protein 1 n=1 Tax=Giardia muris TaxID=5742 RepID=A0A4Z1T3L4_GIAMU|nr:Ankyrin repeat protein 1 [Giardia muris]|eukprot:TNJ30238.1 Ankyrin repeat protein 1 [Giardia muris]
MVETDLMRAARAGDCHEISRFLNEAGQQDVAGKTALMHAAEYGHLECVNVLKNTVEHQMHDSRGWTALMYACANSHPDCAAALVGERRTVNSKTASTRIRNADYEAELAVRDVYEAELRKELEMQSARLLNLQKVYDQMAIS